MNDDTPNADGTDGRDPAPIEDPDEARIDERARAAGSELRRPAPEGGLAGVQRVRRKRQITRAAVGGTAVLALLVGGIVAIANRDDEAEIGPVDTNTEPITDPTTDQTNTQPVVTEEVTPAPDDTDASAPTVTTEPSADTTEPPPSPTVSDEVLPDPLAFAADGFERELVDRTIVVRSDPEQVIALDVPEPYIWLYGVGPNGVAYLRLEDDTPLTRIVAVPTTGPTTGTVYELIGPYDHDGPWLGFMAPDGIDAFDLASLRRFAPYVDVNGVALEPSIDPTFTWSVDYRYDDAAPFEATAFVVDESSGEVYEVPESEPTREGQFARATRPLPDGRVTVIVGREDGTAVVWALTPATGTWTQHPFPS